ncbi:MAG: hypothetical protein ACK5TN_20505 [Acidobacteriota bacterium]
MEVTMGIGEAIEAVRQLGVVRAEAGRLLIEVDRRHLGALAAHIEVLKRCKAQAVALLEAEVSAPSQMAIDRAADILNSAGVGLQRMGGVVCVMVPETSDGPGWRWALAVMGLADATVWRL